MRRFGTFIFGSRLDALGATCVVHAPCRASMKGRLIRVDRLDNGGSGHRASGKGGQCAV
jgi:hypothetical protein